MKPHHQHLLTGLVSTALGLAVAVWIWNHRELGDSVQMVDVRKEVEGVLHERAQSTVREADLDDHSPNADPSVIMVGRYDYSELSEEQARKMFSPIRLDNSRSIYDPITFVWGTPGFQSTFKARYRPSGDYVIQNNSLGFRRLTEINTTQPDLRVLVTGDSHMEGLVPMPMHLTKLAEELLTEHSPGRRVEVLNAGRGGYSFFNYAGVAKKFEDLKPDIIVVAIYGGNDFKGCLALYRFFNRMTLPPPLEQKLRKKINEGRKSHSALFAQYLNQALSFHYSPGDFQLARQATADFVQDMHAICEAQGAKLLLMYIPPMLDAQPQFSIKNVRKILSKFDLEYDDLHHSKDLATQLLTDAKALGVPCLDLTETFSRSTERMYWSSDHHINTVANNLTAGLLAEAIEQLNAN
jgi:hypothetical protein